MFFNEQTSKGFGGGPIPAGGFEQFFNEFFGGSPTTPSTAKTTATSGQIKHTVTVPGYGAEDIDVNVENARVLVVRTKPEGEDKGTTLARINLVEGADYAKAKAKVKNGLLTVLVPYSAVPTETFSIEVTSE